MKNNFVENWYEQKQKKVNYIKFVLKFEDRQKKKRDKLH